MAVDFDTRVDHGEHVVQFYAGEPELFRTAGSYLADGLRAGEIAIVIAAGEHERGFESHLEAAGIDVAEASSSGALIALDAAATLSAFTVGGRIDAQAFDRVVGTPVRAAVATGRPVRAYGEMVGLLWDAGDVLAAIELEELWSELGRDLRFSLFCAYHSGSAAGEEHADALSDVCDLHARVVPSTHVGEAGQAEAIELSRTFPPRKDSPRQARRLIADVLHGREHRSDLIDDSQLVLGELATNAVLHARSVFAVRVRFDGSNLHLSVSDASPVIPTPENPEPTALSGRGLRLVAALATEWGVATDLPAGKTVWAKLAA